MSDDVLGGLSWRGRWRPHHYCHSTASRSGVQLPVLASPPSSSLVLSASSRIIYITTFTPDRRQAAHQMPNIKHQIKMEFGKCFPNDASIVHLKSHKHVWSGFTCNNNMNLVLLENHRYNGKLNY